MPNDELEGTTLKIYVALVNENNPLGPRELARKTNLSSPSVAYRHLQKLEDLNLVEKTRYGEYTVKQRQSVKGYFWVGGRLFPRLVIYSFFFTGILSVEIAIAAARYMIQEPIQYDFVLLIFVTATSVALFLIEGVLSVKTKNKKQSNT